MENKSKKIYFMDNVEIKKQQFQQEKVESLFKNWYFLSFQDEFLEKEFRIDNKE